MKQQFVGTDIGFQQQTLAGSFVCVDRGLHSGQCVTMTVTPSAANTGIQFIRRDITQANPVINAQWHQVTDTQLSTKLSNAEGVSVSTVEHLMAALRALGIDNARIYIDAPEVPIMDGSSAPFIDMMLKTGLVQQAAERRVIVIKRAVSVQEGSATARYTPSSIPWMDMTIDFAQSVIGRQTIGMAVSTQGFVQSIAKARTFGFAEQLDDLKQKGLAQGSSLDNAILIDNNHIVNADGLRYNDEFVRHKFLDAVGDLALTGHYVIGHFHGYKSGHRLNNQLLRALFASDAWEYMPIRKANAIALAFLQKENARLVS